MFDVGREMGKCTKEAIDEDGGNWLLLMSILYKNVRQICQCCLTSFWKE